MEELRCLRCGSREIDRLGDTYVCRHCGVSYEEDRARQFAESVRSIFGDELAAQKEEQIANARQNLWKAANAQNVSSREVLKWAEELKSLKPDDFMADFFCVACGNNSHRLNDFLDAADFKKNGIYAPTIADFLLRGMDYSTVLPLKNLIGRSMKGDDYKKYMTAVEGEADKIKRGVYSTQVPRDVFLAYSSKDYKAVSEIVQFLESNKITCFVALRNLRHGKGAVENYGNALKEAMHNCKCVVFISSNNSRDLECDALKVEIPYIRDHEPQMGRIEYLLEDYSGTSYAAKRICENFFKNLEYCREKEDLVDRILSYITGFDEAVPQKSAENGFKYCLNCGEKNPLKAKMCMECGYGGFGQSYEEFLKARNDREQSAVRVEFQRQQAELQKQKQELERQRAELERQRAAAEEKLRESEQKRREEEERRLEEKQTAGMSEVVKGYYRKAVQGNASAQNDLAYAYYMGNGVAQDYNKAIEWYTKSAAQGNATAQSWLGYCYDFGKGVEKDYKKAAEWYTKSAEQGKSDAQCHLGILYYNGNGVPKDYKKAVEWFKKSADSGDPTAQCWLGYCYNFGQGVEKDYKKAVEWFRRSAMVNNSTAQCWLGYCYKNGTGVQKDYKSAVYWYKKSAAQGNKSAQEALQSPELKKYL